MNNQYSDDQIRAEYAAEEAAAAGEEIADKAAALSVRLPHELAEAVKLRAGTMGLSVSAYARQVLSESVSGKPEPALTEKKVEDIGRRIFAESRAA